MEYISVHGAPSEYILKEGALELLEEKLLERGIKKALVVHGEKSWEAAAPFWPEFKHVQYDEYVYRGECSLNEVRYVAGNVVEFSYDAIIGVGGGKVLDIVKAASHKAKRQAVLIPTLASNCAPWTPLSVLYDEEGAFIRYEVYPIAASLLLIEPNILLQAPLDLFVAGIGDTLAKWYEADVQIATIENKSVPLQISHFTAKKCKDLLLEYSSGAIEAVTSKRLTNDFIQVAETIIVYGGMVGGFGDHYGRIAGAHAIHNGLTMIEETHAALHGEKVAYGILVQLALEEKWEEIKVLISYYKECQLPVSLRELGIQSVTENVIEAISKKATVKEESIHVMPIGDVTESRVIKAIKDVEALTAAQ